MFFHGEDAVADDLAPFIDAAPREEQKYFLATQQVDEARHAIFFKRFMHEVVGRGDGTIAGGAARRPSRSSPGASARRSRCWTRSPARCARDRSPRRAGARGDDVPPRRRGAARAARPALHLRLPRASATCCPASARACGWSRWTSSATSASASSCCTTSAPRTPAVREAVADLIRERHAVLARGLHPAELGPLLHRVSSASRWRRSTPRARAPSRPSCAPPGCRWSRCPGRRSSRWRCRAAERAEYGLAMLRAGFIGPPQRRAAARPGGDGAAVRPRSPAPSTTAPRPRARSPCSGSSPTPSRGTCASTTARPPRAAGRAPAGRRRAALRFEDWVDIVAGRLDPRRARGDRPAAPARLRRARSGRARGLF